MAYNCIVLVKQVPDTANITGKAMKDTGTVNRAALPAIFNPEDLNALEMALQVKEQYGGRVTVLTMGPPRAAEVLRESLYRGADEAILLTDRKFAGSDTLATSYALNAPLSASANTILFSAVGRRSTAIQPKSVHKWLKNLGCRRSPTLNPSVSLDGNEIVAVRGLPLGRETVSCTVPCLLTVVGSANQPRPPSVRRAIAYKMAATPLEYGALLERWPEFGTEEELEAYLAERDLKITLWTAADLDVDEEQTGAWRFADQRCSR